MSAFPILSYTPIVKIASRMYTYSLKETKYASGGSLPVYYRPLQGVPRVYKWSVNSIFIALFLAMLIKVVVSK